MGIKKGIKNLLKKYFPLPASKQREMEINLCEMIDRLRSQQALLLQEVRILTNSQKQKMLQVDEKDYPRKLKEWFFGISGGKELNLEKPKTFCDKLNWLKLYDRNPMKSLLADKYLAPKYVNYITKGNLKAIKRLGVWENAFDIDWGALPNQFVLKCNHGSSMNIIVKDKRGLNVPEAVAKLNKWISTDYAQLGGCFELWYSDIKPRIIAEEFMNDGHNSLLDYKFHCFNGEPKLIELQTDHYEKKQISAFFDLEWNPLEIRRRDFFAPSSHIPKPDKLSKMLEFARFLSKGFIYVRMDFFCINNEVYFGEYTFSPAAGYFDFADEKTDLQLGSMLELPADRGKF